MLLEFLADADAGITYAKLVDGAALVAAGLLDDAQADCPAGVRELDRVAQYVEKYLLQAQAVADKRFVDGVLRIDEKGELPGLGVRLHDGAQVVQDAGQPRLAFLDDDLAAFDAAHVQHVVDQRQQVAARHRYLLKVVRNQVRVVEMLLRQLGVAHDGVHRRADIVAHAVEEGRFRAVRVLGGQQRLFEQVVLVGFFAHQLVHVVVIAAQPVASRNRAGRAAAAHVALAKRRVDPKVGVLVAKARFHTRHAVEHGLHGLGLDTAIPGLVHVFGGHVRRVAIKAEKLEHAGVGEHARTLPFDQLDAPGAHLGRFDDRLHGGELCRFALLGFHGGACVVEAQHQVEPAVLAGELGGAELVVVALALIDAPIGEGIDADLGRFGEEGLGGGVAPHAILVIVSDELVDIGEKAVAVVRAAQRLGEHGLVHAREVGLVVGVALRFDIDDEDVVVGAAQRSGDLGVSA